MLPDVSSHLTPGESSLLRRTLDSRWNRKLELSRWTVLPGLAMLIIILPLIFLSRSSPALQILLHELQIPVVIILVLLFPAALENSRQRALIRKLHGMVADSRAQLSTSPDGRAAT